MDAALLELSNSDLANSVAEIVIIISRKLETIPIKTKRKIEMSTMAMMPMR